MDSNFRFRASGDTPHRPRGEAASHRSRLPLRRDPPSGRDLDDGTVSQLFEELAGDMNRPSVMYADEKVIIHTVSPLPMPVETTSGVASCKTKIHLLSDQLPKRAFFGGAEAIARRVFWGRPATTRIP